MPQTFLEEVLKGKDKRKTSLPIVFMGYYNPVFKFGEKNFIEKALEVGVDGLILADLPPEKAKDLLKVSREKEFSLIFLLTPVSSSSRIKLVCKVSDGFIYCVSYTGITGEKKGEKDCLVSLVKKARLHTNLPLCVGFGISSPHQAKDLSSLFDGVIVGSAVIRKIKEKRFDPDMVKKVGDFVSSLVQAVK